LDKVAAIHVGVAFCNLHRHLTFNAGKEIDQRALIVVGAAHCIAFGSIGQTDSITRFIAGQACSRPVTTKPAGSRWRVHAAKIGEGSPNPRFSEAKNPMLVRQ
jgi:hypothetical protein